jgi:hypothetical protein
MLKIVEEKELFIMGVRKTSHTRGIPGGLVKVILHKGKDGIMATKNAICIKTHFEGDVYRIFTSELTGDTSGIYGKVSEINPIYDRNSSVYGNASGVSGDVSKVCGDLSHVKGDLNQAIAEYLKKNNLTELKSRIDVNLLIG